MAWGNVCFGTFVSMNELSELESNVDCVVVGAGNACIAGTECRVRVLSRDLDLSPLDAIPEDNIYNQ